ncbi:diguanylate cyclase [Proteiniborus sp. MB09-C3]|uniref:diguanylate cyclase n=1 Tax=Proteiniborus sp. MB09-C3 TaxID=3050072 RepID=UPI00255743FC|nr:diguanylate cyclase [Proteiniborus sp. MB09-C3]WIV12348.1 diguanylate cyclase [Proteiniborus sp. MB09-C3]
MGIDQGLTKKLLYEYEKDEQLYNLKQFCLYDESKKVDHIGRYPSQLNEASRVLGCEKPADIRNKLSTFSLYGNIDDSLEALGRILIVDDDVVTLNILKEIFRKRGYNVILCSNSFEVIKKIKENKIDIAIIDLILPEMDGFEIIESIRKTEPELPVIMLSGSSNTENKIRALGIGADDYITKPFVEKELIARVERALARALSFKAISIEDGLTAAYTKCYFWRKIKEIKGAYQRNKKTFSVAFVDMDDFKNINDTHGHLMGDEALKCFVYALKSSLRFTDYVFRFGGDEFVILFPETNEKNAYYVLERFRDNISYEKCMKSNTGIVFEGAFSAGITEVKNVDDEIEDIIKRADMALYEAKTQGKNKTCIY